VQADACARLGSPLYAELLARASQEVLAGDVVFEVLRGHEDDPGGSALALRLMGAVHRLVLRGDTPKLAAHYPSVGGRPGDPWPAFLATLAAHAEELRRGVEAPVQTNEPGRCAALLGGFLEVAGATGLPLRLLEVGASAGLNLRFDRYRYELGDRSWGPIGSPVRVSSTVTGEPPLDVRLEVASRSGCDARPVDPTTEPGRLTLMSYVWGDQVERLARLAAACAVAADVPATLVEARAAGWTNDQLAAPAPQTATVVFHSVVMQYLTTQEREAFEAALREAGDRATETAPLAWLRMEPGGPEDTAVRLTVWPGGRDRELARAGYHGDPVDWRG
jgi:hypothetical protein